MIVDGGGDNVALAKCVGDSGIAYCDIRGNTNKSKCNRLYWGKQKKPRFRNSFLNTLRDQDQTSP